MKKLLSIILSTVLVITSLGAGTAVFADEQKKVAVEYSVYDSAFVLEPMSLDVSADLSDKYAAEVGYNDSSAEPTILDATIAAHISLYGENFTQTNPLTISTEYGYAMVISSFGKNTSATSYRVNGNYAGGINDTVKNGDYVEYMFYQDTLGWSDAYSFFNTRSVSAAPKQSVTLTLSKEGVDENWNPVVTPAANASVTVNGEVKGKTDTNGKITLTFDKVGSYIISAENNIDSAPIFAPWCVINVSTKLQSYVEKEMKGAAANLLKGVDSLDVNSAIDYLTYLKSGYDMSKYNAAFLASVKANLDKNSGKLYINDSENIAAYGAVIQILEILGLDPTDFEGYNLVLAFESIDVDQIPASFNPYLFRVAIEAASEDLAKKLCDKLIDDHYTMGKGLNNWGYSCDNAAHFLTSIAKYKNDYSAYVTDAKKVIKAYTKNGGAFCDKQWAPDVNANSTALAMMALASVGDVQGAFGYYKYLVSNLETKNAGIFGYTDNKSVNQFATKDALLSLGYFRDEIIKQSYEHPSEVTKTTATVKATTKKNGSITKTCVICGKSSKTTIYYPKTIKLAKTSCTYTGKAIQPKVTVTGSNSKTISASNYTVKYSGNKNVGTAKVTITFKGNYSGSVTKSFKINPKGTKLSKLTKNKKGFTAKWNRQSIQTTGYQLQYSTDKNFKKNIKTVTVSKSSATSKKITGLKAKKKYFVRIRTYKTVNKTRYYSGWSDIKSITTKK